MNRKILDVLGVRYHRFQSNGPITRDPGRLGDIVGKLLRAGAMTPQDARPELEKIFNREFPALHDFWATQPIAVTAAGYVPEDAEGVRISPTAQGYIDLDPDPELDAQDLVEELRALEELTLNDDQRRRFMRLPETQKRTVIEEAEHLVQVRNAIRDAERAQAEEDFRAGKDLSSEE